MTVLATAATFVIAVGASGAVRNGSATFADPTGDAGAAPDVSAVTVSDDGSTLVVHASVVNRTAFGVGDQAAAFLDIDGDVGTGAPAFGGAEVLLELIPNQFFVRRWDGTTFPSTPSPSPSYRAEWAGGYRFSIALSELGMPRKVFFIVKTIYAGSTVSSDLAVGRYNVETGAAEVPFDEADPPAAPSGVRATRTLRQGVRITWAEVEGAVEYEIWRSRTAGGPRKRIGTAIGTTFVDRKAVVRVNYFYAVKATNDDGTSDFSRWVVGRRRG